MRRYVLAFLIAVLSLSLAGPYAVAAEVDLAKAKDIFEKTCGKCHGLDRPLGVAGRDKDGWISAVKRMSGHHVDSFGAPISADDQAAIVEYLAVNAGKK